ncbi:FCD domain-containing protein [Oxalobacteraceae bacterium]|nr:FCD domain-containing protein [Oxalobacteraceae bacterium]
MASMLADSIRSDIIAGTLAPQSKLRLKDLAVRYDAGVIPLREALSRLAMTGFVKAEDQRGFSVTGVSLQELLDITETRKRIETDALRNAIANANGGIDWESQVLSSYYRLSQLPMFLGEGSDTLNPDWEEEHGQFHATLLSGCTSSWLQRFAHMLRDQGTRYRLLSLCKGHEHCRDVMAEHKRILDAILARDTERACQLLEQHLDETMRLVLKQIA